MGRPPRLFVAADLVTGAAIELDAGQQHYLTNVLRLAAGAAVLLFNGRDGEWLGRIAESGRRTVRVELVERKRAQAVGLDLWLLFAPIKKTRLDFLVEKATELGVSELRPVLTQRTVVERLRLDRLAATAIEAAEQCERLTVPAIREAVRLADIGKAWPADRRLFLCDERGEAAPMVEALATFKGQEPLAVLTGPEGGFAESELDALRNLPFVTPVGLGPRILRAETAALAALAVIQAVAGDWRGRPG
jgi:16S rRNA (uracil1498-N3)-methyltransferase